MVASAFDELARDYDNAFTQTATARVLRELVWARLQVLFQPGQRVLELGCGTGEDAVWLASRGIHVTATDASPQMIAVARQKAARCGCSERIEFHCLDMQQAGVLRTATPYDGVLSNFGAVNCVPDLKQLAQSLAPALRPGAALLWVIMGRHVPWEWMWYALHGEPSKGLRRMSRNGVRWRGMRVTYPTPAAAAGAIRPCFAVTRVAPLGCVLPPSYAANWLNGSPAWLRTLTRLEQRAQRWPWLAYCADHYLLEARRRPLAAVEPAAG